MYQSVRKTSAIRDYLYQCNDQNNPLSAYANVNLSVTALLNQHSGSSRERACYFATGQAILWFVPQ